MNECQFKCNCVTHSEKKKVRVYDCVDSSVPVLAKMHGKRMHGFKAMMHEQLIVEPDSK